MVASGCTAYFYDIEETPMSSLELIDELNDNKSPDPSDGEYFTHRQEGPLTGDAGIVEETPRPSSELIDELNNNKSPSPSAGEYLPHEQKDPLTGDAGTEPEKDPLDLKDDKTSEGSLAQEHPFSDGLIRKSDGKFPGAEDEDLQLKFSVSDYPTVEHQAMSSIDINDFKIILSENIWVQRDTHVLPNAIAYKNGYIDIRHTITDDYMFSLHEVSDDTLSYINLNPRNMSGAPPVSDNRYRIKQLSGMNVMYLSINADTNINGEKYVLCFIYYLDIKSNLIESFGAYNKVSDSLLIISTSNIFYPLLERKE